MGARNDGVKCYVVRANVKKSEKTPRAFTFYITQVRDQVSLVRELNLTASYRRSKKIRARTKKLKAWLAFPRKRLTKPIIEAREEAVSL
jgi:predicted patatin/cPLA2 family phospholipase